MVALESQTADLVRLKLTRLWTHVDSRYFRPGGKNEVASPTAITPSRKTALVVRVEFDGAVIRAA